VQELVACRFLYSTLAICGLLAPTLVSTLPLLPLDLTFSTTRPPILQTFHHEPSLSNFHPPTRAFPSRIFSHRDRLLLFVLSPAGRFFPSHAPSPEAPHTWHHSPIFCERAPTPSHFRCCPVVLILSSTSFSSSSGHLQSTSSTSSPPANAIGRKSARPLTETRLGGEKVARQHRQAANPLQWTLLRSKISFSSEFEPSLRVSFKLAIVGCTSEAQHYSKPIPPILTLHLQHLFPRHRPIFPATFLSSITGHLT